MGFYIKTDTYRYRAQQKRADVQTRQAATRYSIKGEAMLTR